MDTSETASVHTFKGISQWASSVSRQSALISTIDTQRVLRRLMFWITVSYQGSNAQPAAPIHQSSCYWATLPDN